MFLALITDLGCLIMLSNLNNSAFSPVCLWTQFCKENDDDWLTMATSWCKSLIKAQRVDVSHWSLSHFTPCSLLKCLQNLHPSFKGHCFKGSPFLDHQILTLNLSTWSFSSNCWCWHPGLTKYTFDFAPFGWLFKDVTFLQLTASSSWNFSWSWGVPLC